LTAAVVMNEVAAQAMNSSRSGMEYWSIETGNKNSRGPVIDGVSPKRQRTQRENSVLSVSLWFKRCGGSG
jgi:hypothetical protein